MLSAQSKWPLPAIIIGQTFEPYDAAPVSSGRQALEFRFDTAFYILPSMDQHIIRERESRMYMYHLHPCITCFVTSDSGFSRLSNALYLLVNMVYLLLSRGT